MCSWVAANETNVLVLLDFHDHKIMSRATGDSDMGVCIQEFMVLVRDNYSK